MENKEIKCVSCGKVEKPENFKKNIHFFIEWIELFPDTWLCRSCKNQNHDKNLVFYKMPINFRGLKKED
ncbi:MAG: hypothetical protein EAX96_10910 [Candidatus Lokiarchaeota archaeon]|nr:hypothetical protein [Candidatus Lokiarchaeota archaeon]